MTDSLRSRHGAAFSLVEVLATIALLALLLVLLSQIFDHTLKATRASKQQISTTRQARAVMDALDADLSNAILENGLSLFSKSSEPNNDTLLVFLTRSRGPSGQTGFRRASVAYELTGQEVRRLFAPVVWSDTDAVQAALSAASAEETSTLARGILRFEAVAVLDNGEILPISEASHTTLFGSPLPDQFAALDLTAPPASSTRERVVAITVAVAAVDSRNLDLPGIEEIAEKLGSPDVGQTPLEVWKTAIASGELDSIPSPTLNALRLTQQTFPLR